MEAGLEGVVYPVELGVATLLRTTRLSRVEAFVRGVFSIPPETVWVIATNRERGFNFFCSLALLSSSSASCLFRTLSSYSILFLSALSCTKSASLSCFFFSSIAVFHQIPSSSLRCLFFLISSSFFSNSILSFSFSFYRHLCCNAHRHKGWLSYQTKINKNIQELFENSAVKVIDHRLLLDDHRILKKNLFRYRKLQSDSVHFRDYLPIAKNLLKLL